MLGFLIHRVLGTFIRISLFACLLFTISGCATWQEPEATTHKALMVVTAKPVDASAIRLRLVWNRIVSDLQLRDVVDVKGVLGETRARIEFTSTANSTAPPLLKIKGLNAKQDYELRRVLSLLPPPRMMGFWLVGSADPLFSIQKLALSGHVLSYIVQQDWWVSYNTYDTRGRPQMMTMGRYTDENYSSDEVDIEIKKWLSQP